MKGHFSIEWLSQSSQALCSSASTHPSNSWDSPGRDGPSTSGTASESLPGFYSRWRPENTEGQEKPSEPGFSSSTEEEETSGYESEGGRSLSPGAPKEAAPSASPSTGRRPRTAFTAEQINSLEKALMLSPSDQKLVPEPTHEAETDRSGQPRSRLSGQGGLPHDALLRSAQFPCRSISQLLPGGPGESGTLRLRIPLRSCHRRKPACGHPVSVQHPAEPSRPSQQPFHDDAVPAVPLSLLRHTVRGHTANKTFISAC